MPGTLTPTLAGANGATEAVGDHQPDHEVTTLKLLKSLECKAVLSQLGFLVLELSAVPTWAGI